MIVHCRACEAEIEVIRLDDWQAVYDHLDEHDEPSGAEPSVVKT